MDYLMGIDLGSTSLKAIIYDLDGNLIASGSRPTILSHPSKEHPEWAVWEPEHIWGDTADAIRDAVGQLDDPRDLKAVAVTGMGMDGVPVDGDGQWLYPFISWHDPRTAPQLQWWKDNITAAKVFSIGGNPLWVINSALRILWMAENEPEILARTDKWLLIEDFLNFMISGRQVTDYSMASTTLLFDQRTRTWSDEMLEASGIDRRLLCEVLPSSTPLGEVTPEAARRTGLAEGTQVVLGGHDHICGSLPVGAFEPGVVLDVTGTWESIQAVTAEPVLKQELREMGVTVQSHVARDRYAIWGGNVCADMVEWYRTQFGFEARHRAEQDGGVDWDHLIAAAADSPPGARGAMFLPHMSGASCPVVDERSLGALVGLSKLSTAGDVFRAIIEGLDYQFRDIVLSMEKGLEISFEKFIAVGGAVRNEFWMQNKADVLGRPIEVPGVQEATPLGVAILAGIGMGLYQDEQDAYQRVYRPGKTYQPDARLSGEYERRFEVYRELYPALASISHRLGEVG